MMFYDLQEAVLSNDISHVDKVLNSVANPYVTGVQGTNLMHYYATNAHKLNYNPDQFVKLLLSHKVDINLAEKAKGSTPLLYAVVCKNLTLVKALLANGATVDAKDKNGGTPLFRAVMDYRGEPEMLEIVNGLVRAGANIDEQNNFGNSPRSVVLDRHRTTLITKRNNHWDLQPLLKW